MIKSSYTIVNILILIVIQAYGIISYYATEYGTISIFSLLESIGLAMISSMIYMYSKDNRSIRGQSFTICNLFLISFFIVHFFSPMSYSLNITDYIKNMQKFDTNYLNAGIRAASCMYTAAILGIITTQTPFKKGIKIKFSFNIGKVLTFLMSLFLIIFYIFTDKRYFQTGGNGLVLNQIGWNPLGYVAQTSFIACFIGNIIFRIYKFKSLSVAQYLKSFSVFFYIISIIYLYLVLSSGDRGPILDLSLSFFAGYIFINKIKVNKSVFIIGTISCALFLSFLGFLRVGSNDLSFTKMFQASENLVEYYTEKNTLFTSTEELSGVVGSYQVIYEYVEEQDCVYCIGIVNQILGIVPGLRPILYSVINFNPENYGTAYLATSLMSADHGMGTTCAAEIYFNVKFIGSLIIFFLFGIFIKKLDLTAYEDSPKLILFIFGFCYLIKAIYIGRSSIFEPLNLCIYTYVYLTLTNFFLKRLK